MAFERKLKKLSQRNWAQIRGLWVPYLGGAQIDEGVYQVAPHDSESLAEQLGNVERNGERREYVEGLHESVFGQAIFCLRRAAHILTSAECHLGGGFVSWSSASSYHSALFSARSILGLLGLATVQRGSVYYSVDLFPGAVKKKHERKFKRGSEMQFMYLGKLGQKEWWAIFQKLLDKTDVQVWDQRYVDKLLQLDERSFATYRNRLIYRDAWWELGDVLAPIDCPWDSEGWSRISHKSIDVNRDEFTISLALILLGMTTALLKDLTEESPLVSGVIGELLKQLNEFGGGRSEEYITASLS